MSISNSEILYPLYSSTTSLKWTKRDLLPWKPPFLNKPSIELHQSHTQVHSSLNIQDKLMIITLGVSIFNFYKGPKVSLARTDLKPMRWPFYLVGEVSKWWDNHSHIQSPLRSEIISCTSWHNSRDGLLPRWRAVASLSTLK